MKAIAFEMDSSRPRVAVVVPCHNYGRYLGACLASIMAQSIVPDRVVVIDDASDDSTYETARALSERYPSLELRRNPRRLGLSSVRNIGAKMTDSEFLCFVDADDTLPENYLDECVRTLRGSGAGYAYPSTHYTGSEHKYVPAQDFDAGLLRRRNYVLSSAVMRRSTVDKIGGWSSTLNRNGVEDWQFWLKALHEGIEGAPSVTTWLNYRRHVSGGANVSRTSARNYMSARQALRSSMGECGLRVIPLTSAAAALARFATPGFVRRMKRRVTKKPGLLLCPVPGCQE